MTKSLRHSRLFLILLFSTYLLACGGGSHSRVAGIDGSGAPATSTSGTINGFGSVIVNGVRYHSDSADILINGISASENNLQAGYQVRVTGTLNKDGSGNAKKIEFNPNIIGSIDSIDLQNEQITVLQQTVQITNTTLFDAEITPNDLSGMSVGTSILVSGQLNSDGTIAATRIELAPQTTYQLTGIINNLNLENSTFNLNNLLVKFNTATINSPNINQLSNGLWVNIIGNNSSDNIFQAHTINVQTINYTFDIKTADVEGFVTRFNATNNFDVAGITCSTDGTTTYENGTSETLALGSSIKVSGSINNAGILVAKKIEYRQKIINEISGEVSTINILATGAISSGSLQVSGTTIYTSNSTIYADNSNDKLRRFNFSDLSAGNLVKVSGYISAEKFIATKIERKRFDNNNQNFGYEGVITQLSTSDFMLYGQTIKINNQTDIRNAIGAELTQEQFLTGSLNQQVRVNTMLIDGVLTATKVEIRTQYQDDFYRPQPDQHFQFPESH